MPTSRIHVAVTGRVQGVGYRAWVEDRATALGLVGWVRNRRDGSVEAVLVGDARSVDAMLAACRDGPRSAAVADIAVAAYTGPEVTAFAVLPTA